MKTLLTFIAALAILAVVGTMDFEDAKANDAYYVSMVCDGLWPNYKNLDITCTKEAR